jgi:uncharacterized protein
VIKGILTARRGARAVTALLGLAAVVSACWLSLCPSMDRQLAVAVRRGDIVAVRGLLDRGADPNTRLHTRPPYRPWPIRSFADVRQWVTARSTSDVRSPTMLMLTAGAGRADICTALLEHGAEVEERGGLSGLPPLLHASARGHTSTVRVILKYGADPNAQSYMCEGGPALADAAARDDYVMATILLDHGADPNGGYKETGDILWCAEAGKRHAMAALLKQYGAKERPDWGLHFKARKHAQR